ncbi:heat-inducible transcriptional repressor HrcA [Citricoccus sp. SGAir0253]|uniref:heat-inducible transcriptional repressor HrcA n=1 Tax=Citricoccus sp. SGAir0253 TaxID=2567881 RepID=UPI0010CD45BC|nr:heat-inducible transcriptional repressor HrcA [Citricoccus sp. SGAir0253]QCU78006.1 heat-inducible transcriptional repressor HrcA [Citricoccus sp. SGAir0253]
MSEHPRRMQVLQAIVEDYVASREPVGSKALVERHRLGVSSATVRNDMAALEEEGLIVAPHTSAGRIPTDKGYRVFVDQISEVKPLSAAERRAVQALLESTDDVNEMMARTVRLLAQLTNQVAVVQYPHLDASTIRQLEVVSLAPRRVLVVVILSSGQVDQRLFATEQDAAETSLEVLKQLFRRHLDGLTPAQAVDGLRAALASVPAADRELATTMAEQLDQLLAARREDRILLAGTANLARSPGDFPYSIGPILEALEEQVVLLRLLAEMEADVRGLSVRIGSENTGSLAETSVIAAGYGPGAEAKLGVVGPTRMDYPGTMTAVRAIARYLSRILSQ